MIFDLIINNVCAVWVGPTIERCKSGDGWLSGENILPALVGEVKSQYFGRGAARGGVTHFMAQWLGPFPH